MEMTLCSDISCKQTSESYSIFGKLVWRPVGSHPPRAFEPLLVWRGWPYDDSTAGVKFAVLAHDRKHPDGELRPKYAD